MTRQFVIAHGGAVRELCRLLVNYEKLPRMIKDRDVLAEALEDVEQEMRDFVDFMPELRPMRVDGDMYVGRIGTCASVIDKKGRKHSIYVEFLKGEDDGYNELVLLVDK